jgi:transposase
MLICFFDSQGIVHKEFVPPGQTVHKQYYCEVLERLKNVNHVRPEIVDTWMPHHDNALCHSAISMKEFLAKKGISVVLQPPYSPDLSSCDFFLFPKLEFHLRGRHFGTVDKIQKVVTDQLRALLHEDFQHCYREWEQHLQRCVASQGNYFEGDNVDL